MVFSGVFPRKKLYIVGAQGIYAVVGWLVCFVLSCFVLFVASLQLSAR